MAESSETILASVNASCECLVGFGKARIEDVPITGGLVLSPDYQLEIHGMMDNGVGKQQEDPNISVKNLAAHIEAQPVVWAGGTIELDPSNNVVASNLSVHEAASRLAVCIKRMHRGECSMYGLGPKKEY